jgi:hypothetical protein
MMNAGGLTAKKVEKVPEKAIWVTAIAPNKSNNQAQSQKMARLTRGDKDTLIFENC